MALGEAVDWAVNQLPASARRHFAHMAAEYFDPKTCYECADELRRIDRGLAA